MLGGEITFSYCRQPGQELPCRKIFDCWWEEFDITAFMTENFTEETRNSVTQPPKQKALSILEIVEQARKNNLKQ
jgi:hypothetical protein